MSYRTRILNLVIIDSIIVLFSIYMSHFFLNPFAAYYEDNRVLISSIILLISHHVFSYVFGLYRKVWRYASAEELVGIVLVVTSSIAITAISQKIMFGNIYARGLFLTFLLHLFLLGGVRFWWRFTSTVLFAIKTKEIRSVKHKRTLILGAGSTGRMLVRQLKEHPGTELKPIAFLDDDASLQNLNIVGIPVVGKVDDIVKIIAKFRIEHVVIAIPSLPKSQLNEIVAKAKKLVDNVQILPMIGDLAVGKVSVNQIRDISIEDLLGREPVELDTKAIAEKIRNQTVLITGAGGSIGSELCRQICLFHPSKLILLGHGENSIYNIEMELLSKYKGQIILETEIAEIQDARKMIDVMVHHKPKFVFHAAAHKHVPLMEKNPEEAVKNNIYGTRNVAEAASIAGVDTFVLVSTDKAVNPTSVMGASKRIAELTIQNLDRNSDTRFVAVRFGNVLGSRGSVVPLFKNQIAKGGPLTITHPDMTRYFMTIPEAARLVIQAGALARGGEIFVLDMGEPVKIIDLAKNLIRLSGFTEDEIKIEFTGLRPGEKMYEEILNKDEIHPGQVFPKIYIGKATEENAENLIQQIESVLDDKDKLRETLLRLTNKKQGVSDKKKEQEQGKAVDEMITV
ncbi:polysaccharide biosynthesis protein [Fredinandcohnia salidurans]|uniref:Polysaccharide biosynthesis protein n=1 Tax=Fredinandcohnia salidurans TaxID=2595041 RepID=A0ABW4MQT3_9BACI|nr:nucleoside-diphosphate sugar epimerase/dehydratase [Fredinandcohnia onubensis]